MPIQEPIDIIADTSKISLSSEDVQQSYAFDCAVRSQEIVLRDFGIYVSEDELCHDALEHGWYDADSGTAMTNVGNLLEEHGVQVNRYVCSNQYQLAHELAQGHRVIVAVDADELHEPGVLHDIFEVVDGKNANHALIVSGLDYSDPMEPRIFLTDPGTGEPFASYPMHTFLNAWEDSNFFMVSTADAAPGIENFDYSLGHIENLGEGYGSWDDFSLAFAGLESGFFPVSAEAEIELELPDASFEDCMQMDDALDSIDDLI